MRGEAVTPIIPEGAIAMPEGVFEPAEREETDELPPPGDGGAMVKTTPLPTMVVTGEERPLAYVGKPELKVDALKLVQGKPAFTDDVVRRVRTKLEVWSSLGSSR